MEDGCWKKLPGNGRLGVAVLKKLAERGFRKAGHGRAMVASRSKDDMSRLQSKHSIELCCMKQNLELLIALCPFKEGSPQCIKDNGKRRRFVTRSGSTAPLGELNNVSTKLGDYSKYPACKSRDCADVQAGV